MSDITLKPSDHLRVLLPNGVIVSISAFATQADVQVFMTDDQQTSLQRHGSSEHGQGVLVRVTPKPSRS